jgi:S-DNA-T family DNA segregation ATPase FtsK/SpoIIIE
MECFECGYVYGATATTELPDAFLAVALQFGNALRSRSESILRLKPEPALWSPLEYSCHVRDVFLAQRERVLLALVEDTPSFASIYRDQRPALARYNASAPDQVAQDVEVAARLLAWLTTGLSTQALDRPCVYNYPEPERRDVGWLLQHALHEGVHHLRDIEVGIDRAEAGDALPGAP